MRTNWNAARFAELRELGTGLHKRTCTGWKGSYHRPGAKSGYHKQLKLSEMRVLVDRLQRQAAR